MKTKECILEVADTQANVERGSCDFWERFDTIKEAKERARNLLNPEFYQRLSESSGVMRYARIMVDGECLYDFFAKGYNGETEAEEQSL